MGIKFFRPNVIDLINTFVTFLITDSVATNTGSDFTDLMRNRDNNSGWYTTGSSDAGTTTMICDFGEERIFDSILLVGHNLKDYTLKYWDGTSAYINFSNTIHETANAADTTSYNFTEVSTSKLQLIINKTIVTNADKFMKQFIVTSAIGTLSIEPEVIPMFDKSRKATKFLSGKQFVAKSVGGFTLNIKMNSVSSDADLSLMETLYGVYSGFLVWPCGGTITQFESVRQGYRLQDIFLMDAINEYMPQYVDSRWVNGMPINIKLVEVS